MQIHDHLSISKNTAHLKGTIILPSSKSISNRVLMIRSLCTHFFDIENLSDSSDTQLLNSFLQSTFSNEGLNVIDLKDAGTPYRFLTAYFAMQSNNRFLLNGTERMKQRPVAPLVNALWQLGAQIYYMDEQGFLPLLIEGNILNNQNEVEMDTSLSSQFVSALCLIAPTLEKGLKIKLLGSQVSQSYTQMTLELMKQFGIEIYSTNEEIKIEHQKYQAKKFCVESDWSSACFFYAMAIISENVKLTFLNFYENSLQGDSQIVQIARRFGVETIFENNEVHLIKKDIINDDNIELDLSSFPDMAVPLIVVFAMHFPKVQLSGLSHLQHKESDRIFVLQRELKKVHIYLHYQNGILRFENSMYRKQHQKIFFKTYQDHRIAMALSLLSLDGYEVVLDTPQCVSKSFPSYFDELIKIGFRVE